MSIKIYVEGGGESNKLRTECRRGFTTFFENAGLSGRMPSVSACGSRNDTYDSFCTAVNISSEGTLPLLLVDSEEALLSDSQWAHLKSRDDWNRPDTATDEHAYLMVECMEAWFMADRDSLKSYFGQGFNENSLPRNTEIETIPKNTIYESLKMATRGSASKGKYGKGKHSFEILGQIDPNKVRAAAPNADRLLKKLEGS